MATRKQSKRELARLQARQARRKPRLALLGAVGVLVVAMVSVFVYSRRDTGPPTHTGMPASFVSGSAAGYNVLMVTLDTTRADHLGCYGRRLARTPVLDGLAGDGLLFADAVASSPSTLPSHATIFTGLYPPRHGARRNGEYLLEADQRTLAEILSDRGYDSAAFVSAFVLDRRFGLDQGFGLYDDAIDAQASLGISDSFEERSADKVTDAALSWFREREHHAPFFAWIHYFDPHSPFVAPEPYAGRLSDPYDAEIAFVDSELGRLKAALEELGLIDRTLIVVVADHGEGLGEHGEVSHDFFLYESVMRVPLILSCPGVFRGAHVDAERLVSTADIVPTVLDALGIDLPAGLDGGSLLAPGRSPERTVYMESLGPYTDYGWAPLFALRRHEDKLILAPSPEYYVLSRDPNEQDNRFDDPPSDRAGAPRELTESLERLLAGWPTVVEVGRHADDVDSETRERLQSLGYVGGISPTPEEGRLDPKQMLPLLNRLDQAKALARGGRVNEAVAELSRLSAEAPRSRAILGQLARMYAVLQRFQESESAARQSIEIGPAPETLTLLAQVLIAQGRSSEAGPLAHQALALDPAHGLSFIVLGDIAAAGDRLDEARLLYGRALEVDSYRSTAAVRQRMAALQQRRRELGLP